MLDGQISHDQVSRFLASAEKTSADVWRVVKPLVRQVESEDGVLMVDDSIEEKPYTDDNELIGWHGDQSQQRQVKGINFLTALYQVGEVALPMAFDLVTKTEEYSDPQTGRHKRRISKNARDRMLLSICVHNQIKCRYVLSDVWRASADTMTFLVPLLKKHFVMPLKENRQVALSLEHKRGQDVAVTTLDLPEGPTREMWLEEVDVPRRLVKQVFTKEDGSTGTRYLMTSDLTHRITAPSHRRWSVEVYHRSLKQKASLENSSTRTETTQCNHLFASLCASIKLERVKLGTGLNHFAWTSKISLSALQAAYAQLVTLNPQPLAA